MWISLFFHLVISFALASAEAAPLFGPEFELTNNRIFIASKLTGGYVDGASVSKAKTKLTQAILRRCPNCRVRRTTNDFGSAADRIYFPGRAPHPWQDFWIQVSTDPGTVEVQAKPSTLAQFRESQEALKMLFDAGREVGLSPDALPSSAGHLHIDIDSAFRGNSLLFRNFLVDFANHSEFNGGKILGADPENAPHVSALTLEQKRTFREVIKEFDEGKIRGIADLAQAVNRRVYFANPAGFNPPAKYQALNLSRAELPSGSSTLEIRSLGSQRGPEEFFAFMELFQKRIEFLNNLDRPVAINDLAAVGTARGIAQFRSYVEESGLEWEKYRGFARNTGLHGKNPAPASTLKSKSDMGKNAVLSWKTNCRQAFRRLASKLRP